MKSLLLSCSLLLAIVLAHAQRPGTPDPSFGNKGILINSSPIDVFEYSFKLAKDGRLVGGTLGSYKGFNYTFRIDAFMPDGSPDLSFGEQGSAYVVFPGMKETTDFSSVTSLALLPDGRILASGYIQTFSNPDDIALARFMPNGTLDSTFGINGTVTTTFGYADEGSSNLTLQPDGKFLIGSSLTSKSGQTILYTARFLPNGSKDVSYGSGGIALGTANATVSSLSLQKDGKIVAAGYSFVPSRDDEAFHIERYNPDGSYDNSFDENGIVSTQVNGKPCVINSAVLQDDGKIVVTGKTGGIDDEPLLTVARYNTDGSLDNSFGKEGIVTTPMSQYGGDGKQVFVTGEKGDKIVVAGINVSYFDAYENFALTGYNSDGSLDSDFGDGGIQITDLGGLDEITAAAIQTDGKIVVTGYYQSLETFEQYRTFARYYGYPQKVSLIVRIKRWLQNHTLTWKGLPAEDKIAYYTVEQSSNSSRDFTPVAKVSGVSNLKDYSITNSHLVPGANYYRIKAVSTDGVVRYSEVVSADNMANTASVYPNPAKSYVTVQGLPTNETANISIADGSGNVKAKGVSNGAAQYRSPLNNLLPGTYYVNITTNSKTETVKFVKE